MPTQQELNQALLLALLNRATEGGEDAAADLDKLEALAKEPEALSKLVSRDGPKNSLPTKKGTFSGEITKGEGTCGQGERADLTGCTPASGSGGKKPSKESAKSSYSPKHPAEYYGEPVISISPTAHQFVVDWLDDPKITPSDAIIKDLTQFLPTKAKVTLYRGGDPNGTADLQSWSKSKEIAEEFASYSTHAGTTVRKMEFPREVVLFDTTRFPTEYKDQLQGEFGVDASAEEVVVATGEMAVRIKKIRGEGAPKNSLPAKGGPSAKVKFFRNGGVTIRRPSAKAKAYRKKMALRQLLKAEGSCKPGQTAASTGCTPASGGGGKKPSASKPDKKVDVSGVEVPTFQNQSNMDLAEQLHKLAVAGDFDALENWKPPSGAGSYTTNALNNYKQNLLDKVQEHYQNNPEPEPSKPEPTVKLPDKPKVMTTTHPFLAENIDALEKLALAGDLEGVKNYINPGTGVAPMTTSTLGLYQEKLIQAMEAKAPEPKYVPVGPVSTPQQVVQATKQDLQPNKPLPKTLKSGVDTSTWSTTNSSAKFAANKIKQLEDLASAGKWDEFEKQKYVPTSAKPNTYQKKMVQAYQALLAQKAKDDKGFVWASSLQPQAPATSNGQTSPVWAKLKADILDGVEKYGFTSTDEVEAGLGASEEDAKKILEQMVDDGLLEEAVNSKSGEGIYVKPQGGSNLAGKPCPPGVSAAQTGCIPAQDQQGAISPKQPKPGSFEAQVLDVLDAAGSVNVEDLADELEITPGGAKKLLEAMTKDGYLIETVSQMSGQSEWIVDTGEDEGDEEPSPVAAKPTGTGTAFESDILSEVEASGYIDVTGVEGITGADEAKNKEILEQMVDAGMLDEAVDSFGEPIYVKPQGKKPNTPASPSLTTDEQSVLDWLEANTDQGVSGEGIDASDIMADLGISPNEAKALLKAMVGKGVLVEEGTSAWGEPYYTASKKPTPPAAPPAAPTPAPQQQAAHLHLNGAAAPTSPPQEQMAAKVVNTAALMDVLKKANVHDGSIDPTWKLKSGQNPKSIRYGCVLVNDKGQVLLRKPSGHFGGLHWTFAKGGQEAGDTAVDCALREVSEEVGYQSGIFGTVPGIHNDGYYDNAYFMAKVIGGDGKHDWETSEMKWVDMDEAEKLINESTFKPGKNNDLAVLKGAKEQWNKGLKDKQVIDPNSPFKGKPCPVGVSAAATGCIPQGDNQSQTPAETGDVPSAEDWAQTGGQGGTNPGGKFKDKQGKEWYVKFSKTPDHAKNEVTAAKLYELAGAGVPEYQLVKTKTGLGTASGWMAHSPVKFDPHNPQHKEMAALNFGVHAWLGNYDAMGSNDDNQVFIDTPSGPQLVTIDTGGSILFRAQGKDKGTGGTDAWGNFVEELTSMTSPKPGHSAPYHNAAKVFGNMTPEQKLKSFQKVLAITPDAIKAIVDKYGPGDEDGKKKLYTTLLMRKAQIADEANKIAAALLQGGVLPGATYAKPVNTLPKPGVVLPVHSANVPPKAIPVYSIPPVPVINHPTYQKQVELIWEAAQLSLAHVEQLHTNGTSKHGYTKKVHAYKMSVLSALKSGATPQTGQHAGATGGTPSQAIPGAVPAKPTFNTNAAVANNLVNNMEKYALKGDISVVMSVDPSMYTSMSTEDQAKLGKYKNDLLKSVLAGKPCPPGVSAAQTGCIPAGAGGAASTPKIKPFELPSKPTVTSSDAAKKAQKQADVDAMEKLALAGDLAGLQTFKVSVPSSTTTAYQNDLVAHINDILNPPAPPKPYAGQLDNLKKVYKGSKDPGISKKLGFYLVTEEPGVPNVAFKPIYHATDSSKSYDLVDPVLSKQHKDAIAAMKKESPEAVALMKKYTGSYSGSINHSIWNTGGTPAEKKMGQLMIKHAPIIPVGTVLRRHIDLSGQVLKDMLNSAGKVLQEPAGMSTSVNKNHSWSGNVHLHLTAGPGVKAMYVAPMSDHDHEREMFTPPGTRYLITKVETGPCGPQDPTPCGKYRVHAIILPTEDGQCC